MSYSVYSRYYKSDYCSYMPSVLYIYIHHAGHIYSAGWVYRESKQGNIHKKSRIRNWDI